MSLILDALRKSEAERRRGQAPELLAELPPLKRPPAQTRRTWPVWLAAGAVVLAGGWWLRSTTHLVVEAGERSPLPQTAPPTGREAAPAPVPAPVATAVIPPNPAPARTAIAQPLAAAAPPSAVPPASDAIVAARTPAPPTAAVEDTRPPAPAAATALPALPPTAAADTPQRLSDLSPGEREQLPPLKVSMHMWGPSPEQRFAIIDGTRVGQGDRIGDAVVEEITADGVVLAWAGRHVALSIH